uniref:Chaperone DnaJ n=1 Tax=Aplanochytrium stocchinoi TaxID=215587 RepID=A0A6S8CSW1_9STRA|mmetsp:Transcript_22820/g.29126  ORF Transcript_22820/g.29126 Transcript_22820/m.29126 type:complete len:486 (+) Transcript_22820:203-1660(+)|eukprot:CAMPEP_0204822370 /NCGR_PEP_ID=MMETSP1346-20131115/554_1 /ASSEMBLY_ACC=CAM_ASM_000771 /TAXON_ID=215587 /ORGANISM="Aplanochytrium stocchinoi, Strain GSBS06" /LENGTH=485 /DNA_ID=CAMNT_0051948541 /DNA_START=148 /DNA_END=1605 /DNA_ORIENTATION=-
MHASSLKLHRVPLARMHAFRKAKHACCKQQISSSTSTLPHGDIHRYTSHVRCGVLRKSGFAVRLFHGSGRVFAAKDYYEILGANKGDSTKDIKKKFRKMAKKYHPDTSKDAAADEKFKEISEAWEVLQDDQERKAYDMYGHEGYQQYKQNGGAPPGGGDMGGMNMEDLFRNMGGMGGGFEEFFGGRGQRGGMGRRGPSVGQTIALGVNLSFMDAVKGCTKSLKYKAQVRCRTCDGKGTKDGAKEEFATCGECHGQGVKMASVGGMMQVQIGCDRCRGTGQILQNACRTCSGNGLETGTKETEIKIPAGVDSGMQMSHPGWGDSGPLSGPPGDLVLQIHVQKSDRFQRDGLDVFTEVPITFQQSLLGGTVDVDTIDGKVEMKIHEGTSNGESVRMRGRGVPEVNNPRIRGSQYVTYKVEMPTNLNERQKELIREFGEEEEKKKKKGSSSMFKDALNRIKDTMGCDDATEENDKKEKPSENSQRPDT